MVLGIIPARFASTRFPGKPLVDIGGASMIRRVYEQVRSARSIDKIVVATDDPRIFEHVQEFGGLAMYTDAGHQSGTDRCAEIAAGFPDARFVLNIQGDEPFIQPEQIDLLADTLTGNDHFKIATLAKVIEEEEMLHNPNIVKVVFSEKQGALYFSRQAIPFLRNRPAADWLREGRHYKHIGLYGFQRDTLLHIARLSPSPLEMDESLEQLRWLENGLPIAVVTTRMETIGIDTPDDLERLRRAGLI